MIRNKIIDQAVSLAGTPYNVLDCSAFTQRCYAAAGLQLPRTTQQQYEATRPVPLSQVKPGDLLFFEKTYQTPDHITHVGISLGTGTGQIWHGVEPVATVSNIFTEYWQSKIVGSGRHHVLGSATGVPSGELTNTIDVSNHQPTDISHWIRQFEVKHVIVKLYQSIEIGGSGKTHAQAQIKCARDNGCTVGGYVWLYHGIPIKQQIDDALAVLKPTTLWLDIEPYTDGTLPTIEEVHAAINYAISIGQKVGIYSGPWVWEPQYFNGYTGFSSLPLWSAEYNNQPTLDRLKMFGGWTKAVGHQYTSTPIDRNVFDSNYAT